MVINMYLLNCFFIYSILGFLLEGTFTLITKNNFSSGILYGPWTPVYGIGAILTIIISNKIFKNMHKNRKIETVVTFIILSIVLTLIEWIGGIIIEKLFNETMWNYQNYKFNIGKYISLEISIIWGFLALLIIYLIHPKLDKFIIKIPRFVTIIMLIIFIIDLILTLVKIM